MQDFAKDFYKSKAWKDCRKAYRQYRHGLCERCLEKGIYKPGEIVHHKIHLTPFNIHDPDVALGFENLMLVCRDCHAALHKPERRFRVDDLGRVTAI